MSGGLTPLEYAQSRYPLENALHEIIANPPCDDEDDEVEIQPEQLRKQMYDRSDFVDGKIFVDSALMTTFTFYSQMTKMEARDQAWRLNRLYMRIICTP